MRRAVFLLHKVGEYKSGYKWLYTLLKRASGRSGRARTNYILARNTPSCRLSTGIGKQGMEEKRTGAAEGDGS
jgi:hypothetical protein